MISPMTSSRVQLRPPSRAQVARHTILVEINHAVPTNRALRLLVIRLRPRRAPCAQPCRACPAGWAIVTGAVVDVRLLAGCAGSARHAIRPCKHSRQSRKNTVGRKTGGAVAPCCSAGHGSQPMGPILLPSASGSGLRQTEVSYRSLACEGALGAHLACAGIWPAAHTEHTPFPSCVVAFPSGQARQRCLSCDGSFPSTHSTQVPSS